jgi:mannose-6-phosphate isomerase-like protein (cupin superfamily)
MTFIHMSIYLSRTDESKEFFTNERCHILEMLDNHNSEKTFSIARARVEPGVTTAWHRLSDIVEYYYIISGKGFMEIGEQGGFDVRKNDTVTIPANSAQRIQNMGDEDLIFLAICNPPFTDTNYEDLENV